MTDGTADADCNCKVGSLAAEYGLADANDELVARWTGVRGDAESVRSLTDWFNRRLLREEMRAADVDTVEGRVENLYDLLTNPETLEGVRMEAESILSQSGVDVEELQDRFVSHQSVYRHLRNCLGAEKATATSSVEKERERVNSLQNRSEAVIDDSLGRLRDAGKLAVADFEVLVNFRVSCEECGALHDVADLLARGGCDCQQP